MKIAVINTGGTISCVGDPLAPMTAADFAAACRSLLDTLVRQACPDVVLDYIVDLPFPGSASRTLDSTNLQPTDWCLLAAYILDHYDDHDGWVILHGTDSMDFTGGALPFLLSSFDRLGISTATLSKPVILTGSQVPMFHQDSSTSALTLRFNTDAYQNFCGAVASAQSGIPEVCVYFDSHLFRGCRVLKTDANQFDAFSSPNYPALASMGINLKIDDRLVQPGPVSRKVSLDDPEARQRARAQLAHIAAHIDDCPVMPFCAFPAKYDSTQGTAIIASLIDACVAQGVRGLVLQSYGEGNFPSGNPDQPARGATYQALARADAAGVVIVDGTQVLRGTVNASAYAAGAWLPAVGALSPADMTPMAAFGKLMVLLAAAGHQGWSPADVKRLMQWNLLGEMLSVSRLDSRTNARLRPGESISALDGSAELVNDPAAGPVLRAGSGQVLWSALSGVSDGKNGAGGRNGTKALDLPGTLVMQDDGNLVFYDRQQTALWATGTGLAGGASSLAMLEGSMAGSPDGAAGDGKLCLRLLDYAHGRPGPVLFGPTPA